MIAKLRALLAAATPGEWHQDKKHCRLVCDAEDAVAMVNLAMPTDDAYQYAALIVAAHNALPALLDVVEAAKAMREAFAKNPGHWPQMGWTPTQFDAALARLEGGE